MRPYNDVWSNEAVKQYFSEKKSWVPIIGLCLFLIVSSNLMAAVIFFSVIDIVHLPWGLLGFSAILCVLGLGCLGWLLFLACCHAKNSTHTTERSTASAQVPLHQKTIAVDYKNLFVQLVQVTRDIAERLTVGEQEIQLLSTQWREKTDHQSTKISITAEQIRLMVPALEFMATTSTHSIEQAEHTVVLAKNSSEKMHTTLNEILSTREYVQEVSKRVKHLGESSQEIGEILLFITDVADQTNILALNAAIQASVAGESGRSFALIADEMQRLAERTISAIKQIEAWVRTIQKDASESIVSIEQTIAEIIRGATNAQDLGGILKEIEMASHRLLNGMHTVAATSRKQALSVEKVIEQVGAIQECVTQTASGVSALVQSIGRFSGISGQMKAAIEDFHLAHVPLKA